jgi:hypothetical protein
VVRAGMSVSRAQSATTVASSLAPRARDGDRSTGHVISLSIYNVQAQRKATLLLFRTRPPDHGRAAVGGRQLRSTMLMAERLRTLDRWDGPR